jgi:hypothetical protein
MTDGPFSGFSEADPAPAAAPPQRPAASPPNPRATDGQPRWQDGKSEESIATSRYRAAEEARAAEQGQWNRATR